jgi:hypothetical protein
MLFLLVALVAILLSQVHLALAAPPLVVDQNPPNTTVLSPPLPADVDPLCAQAASQPNPVAAENTCPGTTSWQMDLPAGPKNAIAGFVTPNSVVQGETIRLYVTTTAPTYWFEIYRLGWYQGYGGRLLYRSPQLVGTVQPVPIVDPSTRMVSAANWLNPVLIHVPASWVSGVYIVKLLSSDGYLSYQSYAPFVVRDDASRVRIQIVIPFLTYQAYNAWGGYSLYDGDDGQGEAVSANRAYAVSFDRPYDRADGLGDLPRWDLNTLRWFERRGYDVTYTADVDLAVAPASLLRRQLIVISGHAEYWSTAMRAAIVAAQDAGVSLAFLGADDLYWHVRLQASALGSDRVVVCYRDASLDPLALTDPGEATVRWRDPPDNLPEGAIMGAMYGGIYRGALPLTFTAGATPLLAGTGLHAGSKIPGLIGTEVDAVYRPARTSLSLWTTVLATTYISGHYTSQNQCSACGNWAATTLSTTANGARVFDAGTLQFAAGLDTAGFGPAPPVHASVLQPFQQFMMNLLAYLLHEPAP